MIEVKDMAEVPEIGGPLPKDVAAARGDAKAGEELATVTYDQDLLASVPLRRDMINFVAAARAAYYRHLATHAHMITPERDILCARAMVALEAAELLGISGWPRLLATPDDVRRVPGELCVEWFTPRDAKVSEPHQHDHARRARLYRSAQDDVTWRVSISDGRSGDYMLSNGQLIYEADTTDAEAALSSARAWVLRGRWPGTAS